MYDLQSFPKEKNVPGQKSAMDKEIFDTDGFSLNLGWNSILFPKLFDLLWEKNCSSDREKLWQKILRPLEQFIQTVKGKNNF